MPSTAKLCRHCGAPQIQEGAFCGSCGQRLLLEPASVPATAAKPVPHTNAWQATVGDQQPVLPAATPPASYQFNLQQIPGTLLRQLFYRIPAMLLTIPLAWVLHTYLLVVKNQGWQGYDHPVAAYLNVQGNARAAFISFGVGSALIWTLLFTLLRHGPRATANILLAPARNLQSILLDKDPNSRLGLALGLALVLLGNNYLGLSSSTRLLCGGFMMYWGMGLLSGPLNLFLGQFFTGLKGRFPWLRSLDMAVMVRTLVASLPLGFLSSWFLSWGLSDKLGWLALAFVAYTLYTHYKSNQGSPPPQANLLLLVGFWAVLAHCGWADDGGWSEAGGGSLTPDNVIRWWNSVGANTVVNQGLTPSLGAALGAGLSPPLNPPKDGEDPNRIIGYILHLNADRFTLEANKPATLAVTVYSVTASGQQGLAAGAGIELVNPCAQLQVQPSSGTGSLQSSLSWDGTKADSSSIGLVVNAAAGGTNHTNTVHIELADGYELVVTVQSYFTG